MKPCFLFTDNSVLRVPILYGQIENLAESAVTVLFEKVKDTSAPAKMCNIQRRFPTHCDDVAYILRELADKRLQVGLHFLQTLKQLIFWYIYKLKGILSLY